jgi:hypothetical protein
MGVPVEDVRHLVVADDGERLFLGITTDRETRKFALNRDQLVELNYLSARAVWLQEGKGRATHSNEK